MTRKHFRAIAAIIRQADLTDRQRKELAKEFAAFCATTTPGFRRQTFIDAATG